ncbi:hypothetical protein [Erwinia sp. Leaf53]|uniref:hypothetical protein n=1 Tax=Erwinia sp. Leaf53 TaxID=1736225 RepID=UPI0006F2EC1F|nr:hypothetical protein [Erwinia sp. Leaf53]KQN64418.1 hypothetical protein ASF13_00610 [Erwinia sp. Leaf53]
MYYSNAILTKMASDKILARKLEDAISGVKDQATDQLGRLQGGATRIAWHLSCFTDNYQDVCSRLKTEDVRFFEGLHQLYKDRKIIYELIRVYVELILKNKTDQELNRIKRLLIKMGVNISTSYAQSQSLTMGITMAICLGSNVSIGMAKTLGKFSGWGMAGISTYGYIQKAADSAQRLKVMCPAYYYALYMRGLEMMYFLVESQFMKAHSFIVNLKSLEDIANAIASMVR